MEENGYPKVELTPDGWVVKPNARTKLPGTYTNQRRALKALSGYEMAQKRATIERAEKAEKKKAAPSKSKKAK